MKLSLIKNKLNKTTLLFLLASSLTLASCTSYRGIERISDLPLLKAQDYPNYIIQPGDNIDVKFFYSQDLNDNVTVGPDGNISLQLIDSVKVAGLTVDEVDERLTKMYKQKLPDNANLSVILKDFSNQRIYLAGEVARPGEYPLRHNLTILQAVAAAGGFRDTAKRSAVLVVRQELSQKPKIFLAELTDKDIINKGKTPAYNVLRPRDIVIIPKTNIAKAGLFMDQHVRDILRFNGFSAGVTGIYDLNGTNRVSP